MASSPSNLTDSNTSPIVDNRSPAAIRKAKSRAHRAAGKRAADNALDKKRMATNRAVESPEKNTSRRLSDKQYKATSRAVESPEKNATRLLADKQRHAEGKNNNNINFIITHESRTNLNSIYMFVL